MIWPEQHTVEAQHLKIIATTTADRITLALWPANEPPIPPESTTAVDIQNKNLEGAPLFDYRFLDH